MFPKGPVGTEILFIGGLAVMLLLWVGASASVIVNRVRFDRRVDRLIDIARALADPSVAALPPLVRSPAMHRILSRKTRDAVYRMIASTAFPTWVSEACAAYAIDRWGMPQMLRDAAPHRRRRKWRRISALFALGHIRANGVHHLLEAAAFDPDPEVAGAAGVALQRLGDRRAAEILVAALRDGPSSRSRIATQLDQYPIEIGDLLIPLLTDPRPHARFWGASLMVRYQHSPGLAQAMGALAADSHPAVRRAALETLSGMADDAAASTALRLLDDPIAFVRTTAARTLGQRGKMQDEHSVRRAYAVRLSSCLADMSWDVRFASKEALEALGPSVWREVAVELDSPDAFARNGAAEVLQNLGLLDVVMEEWGHGLAPSAETMDILEGAFREGGQHMVDAAISRLDPELVAGLASVLGRLRLVSVQVP